MSIVFSTLLNTEARGPKKLENLLLSFVLSNKYGEVKNLSDKKWFLAFSFLLLKKCENAVALILVP